MCMYFVVEPVKGLMADDTVCTDNTELSEKMRLEQALNDL